MYSLIPDLSIRYLRWGLLSLLVVSLFQVEAQNTDLSNKWMSVEEVQNQQTFSTNSIKAVLKLQQTLTKAELAEYEAQGAHLLEIMGGQTYLFELENTTLLENLPIEGIQVFNESWKLSKRLRQGIYPLHAISNGELQLNIWKSPDVSLSEFLNTMEIAEIDVQEQDGDYFRVSTAVEELDDLAEFDAIYYIEPKMPDPFPEGHRGRALHRMGTLSQHPGQGFDGSGIGISIADDGGVNHIDFLGRLEQLTSSVGGDHGDMTAGLAVGAGNLDPLAIGMAPGSHLKLYEISSYPHVTNAVSNLLEDNIAITSTSFLEDCGGYYTNSARALDLQVYENEELLHVFSAGNSAGNNCSGTYGHVVDEQNTFYGNITGGRKAAKSSLAVANLYYNDVLHHQSSRGPTEDGRIKPDIAAHGQGQRTTDSQNTYQSAGGTSAAAPTIAGIMASLYQAYEETHNQGIPPAGLMKGILLNTAEDLGRPGPDYEYGWGRAHAARALEVIQEEQFTDGYVSHNSSSFHNIFVPAGTKILWKLELLCET